MKPYVKIRSKRFSNIDLKIVDGHFATPNSHINYYIELNTMKSRQSEAMEAARAMAENYNYDTIVDTIVCMDGMEVIGAYLAEELSRAGIHSLREYPLSLAKSLSIVAVQVCVRHSQLSISMPSALPPSGPSCSIPT